MPAPFRAMQYISEGRYLREHGVSEIANLLKERQNKAEIYQMCSPDSPVICGSRRILAVRDMKTSNLMESSMPRMIMSTTLLKDIVGM